MKSDSRHISIKPISHWYLVALLSILVLFLVLSIPTAVATGLEQGSEREQLILSQATRPKALNLPMYKGKVVVVEFWGSWCYQCAHSIAWLNGLSDRYKSNRLVVLGVNLDTEHKKALQFEKKHPVKFSIIYDHFWQHADFYAIKQVPTIVIFNQEGKILHKQVGFKPTIIKPLETLLKVALK